LISETISAELLKSPLSDLEELMLSSDFFGFDVLSDIEFEDESEEAFPMLYFTVIESRVTFGC